MAKESSVPISVRLTAEKLPAGAEATDCQIGIAIASDTINDTGRNAFIDRRRK